MLMRFDRAAFHDYPSDWFDEDDWRSYHVWWMIVGARKIGCCAFARRLDFREDIARDGANRQRSSSLYIATTGILPAFRGLGFGSLLKCWQISYARHQGFNRIITNTRKSNQAMIQLNRKFGFKVIRRTPDYYADPQEATVVMELRL